MTRKRKVVASVIGVLLLVAVLAGCAGGDGDASASAVRKPAQAGSPVDVFYATLDKQPATSQKLSVLGGEPGGHGVLSGPSGGHRMSTFRGVFPALIS